MQRSYDAAAAEDLEAEKQEFLRRLNTLEEYSDDLLGLVMSRYFTDPKNWIVITPCAILKRAHADPYRGKISPYIILIWKTC